jgi:ATP-binding cassette subfamily B protein
MIYIVYYPITILNKEKLQGLETQKRWEWEDTQADLFNVKLQTLSLQQTQGAGSLFINQIKNLIITAISATAVIHGDISVGMMLSIQYIIGQLNSPIEQIVGFIYQWQDVDISLKRMNEIHSKPNEENEKRNIFSISSQSDQDISFHNVSFSYEGYSSRLVLRNVNLNIPNKKVTAIVGASGSGKTTLLKLLLGYYEPTEGSIQIAGRPLKSFNLTWWRSICGAVMQDGFIFSDSIARNVAASEERINSKKLDNAVRIANIEDYIEKLPLKYNTIVGQEGQGLSQGQKQRLLIARAVYKNPDFLFLDEATNSLDANNEKMIIESLNQFYQNKTVIIIAHRLSTVKNADQIIVLDNGEIVEHGNHEYLTAKKGKYYQLVKNQLELGN